MTEKIDNILFDLDGTLTDPKEGIVNSVLYALNKLGIQENCIDELDTFIGPPLRDSFANRYNLTARFFAFAKKYITDKFELREI